MKEYRVTNRTQGRLELKSIRRVLDAGESVVVAEPLPDEIKFKMGGGPRRIIDVAELPKTSTKKTATQAAPAAQDSLSLSAPTEQSRSKRNKPD